MELISKLEKQLAKWYNKAPHFSPSGQKWLADNSWWLMLGAVCMGSLGVFGVLLFIISGGALLTGFVGPAGVAITGLALAITLFSLSLTIVTLLFIALAINPLRLHQRKGWVYLFIAVLINVVALILDFLIDPRVSVFLQGIFVGVVGFYFLFEMRQYFTDSKENTNPISHNDA